MSDYYILDENKNVIPVYDVLEWGRWFQTAARKVAFYKEGKLRVSTVFLGLDHRFGGDGLLPIVFETMVFYSDNGWTDQDCKRCCTYEEALAMHKAMVKKWRHKIPGPEYGVPVNPLL